MIVQKNPGETIQNKKWHLTKNGIWEKWPCPKKSTKQLKVKNGTWEKWLHPKKSYQIVEGKKLYLRKMTAPKKHQTIEDKPKGENGTW
jgi:hypothetical protein